MLIFQSNLFSFQFSGFAVYNVALFASLGSIVVAVLHNDTTHFRTSYVMFSVCIIESTTVTLCLIFGPKVRIKAMVTQNIKYSE